MKPWHLRDPEGFEREKAEVEREHIYLHFSNKDDQIRIVGSLEIKEGDTDLDRYAIEIRLPLDYPDSVPSVFETGGRIPRIRGRHHYDDTGSACVLLPEERWRVWPKGSSLLKFIDIPVRNFFISQAVFERDGVWPLGQWEHGLYGQKQYYQEMFGSDDLPKVAKYLEYIAAKKMKGHWLCPCGSGKRVRDCHMQLIRDLRDKIPRNETLLAARRLEPALQRLRQQCLDSAEHPQPGRIPAGSV